MLIDAHKLRLQGVAAMAAPDDRDDMTCAGFHQIAVKFQGSAFATGTFGLCDHVWFNPVDQSMVSFR